MTTLKRRIWANYTKSVFEDEIEKPINIWCSWFSNLKITLDAILLEFNINKDDLKDWTLNGAWIIKSNFGFKVNTNNLKTTIRKKSTFN